MHPASGSRSATVFSVAPCLSERKSRVQKKGPLTETQRHGDSSGERVTLWNLSLRLRTSVREKNEHQRGSNAMPP